MESLFAGLIIVFAVALILVLSTAIALGLDGLTKRKRAPQSWSAPAGRVAYSRRS